MQERKRLSLSKDTLRALGEAALRRAVGGDYYNTSAIGCTTFCPDGTVVVTQSPTCPSTCSDTCGCPPAPTAFLTCIATCGAGCR